jgi:RimJ/RimL family protein N-acetyltransferase
VTFDVRVIDPHDEALLRAWWEIGRDATAERPVHAWPVWEISRTALPMRRTDGCLVHVAAFDGERMVGSGTAFLFRTDNTHLAEIGVYVAPPDRRRGIGRAVLAELERLCRAEGRTALIGSAYAPAGRESAGSSFAAALGYPVASAEETKTVDLATAPAGWGLLDEEVAAALDGYRVEVVEERVPDEHVDGFCRLLGAFLGEVPTGDLDLRQVTWSKERLRESEDRAIAVGQVLVIALAIAPDGRLCGFSDVRINRHDPRHSAVGGTLVLPGHRGHRLGLAMKLATHRALLDLFPGCAYVETGNAGVNAAMNAVNERMGYRVVERCLDVQKVL